MAIKVEVEFPVVTKTTPVRGEGKIIIGTSSLSIEVEELDRELVPVTARVMQEEFRVDSAGQFFWKVDQRPGAGAVYNACFYDLYFQPPGVVRLRSVEHLFARSDRAGLKAAFNKRSFDRPRHISQRKFGTFDQALVEQQIAAKAEQLRGYAVIGDGLYVRSEEPLMRVSKFGNLSFRNGDPWTTLAPNQCFSLRELPKAQDLARRIGGKEPEGIRAVEMIHPDRHSVTFRERRIALVNRYVLDLAKEYVSESNTEETGRMLLECTREHQLVEIVLSAARQVGQGAITEPVLAAAESILYGDASSPWSAVIDNVGSARAIIDFLREEWEERPIDIGLSIVAHLR